MRQLASVIVQPWLLWFVVGLLVAWALLSARSLAAGTRSVSQALMDARRRIEEAPDALGFATIYERVSAELAAAPLIGPRWREYRDSLLVPTEENRPVRSTGRADLWFDSGALFRAAGTDLRYHAALPNLLVGAGLLFTFIGLAAALGTAGGIVAGGATQAERNASLQSLLDTASFKFITSLVGMSLSIAYALLRKNCLKRADAAVDGFLAALDARVPLITPVALQAEANKILEAQTTQLQFFFTNLATAIGDKLDNALNTRLAEHIKPLTEAIQKLSSALSSGNEEAIRTMLEQFIKQLQVGAGDRMQEVATKLGTLAERLEALQSGLQGAASAVSEATSGMASQMQDAGGKAGARLADGVQTAVASLTQATTDMQIALDGMLANLGQGVVQAGGEAAAKLREGSAAAKGEMETAALALAGSIGSLGRQAEALGKASEGLAGEIGRLQTAVGDAAKPLASSAADLKAAGAAAKDAVQPLQNVAERMRETMGQVNTAAGQLQALQAAAGSLAEQLSQAAGRFEGVDQGLARTLDALQTGLQGFTSQVRSFVIDTDTNLAKATNQLGSAVKELDDTLNDFLDNMRQH